MAVRNKLGRPGVQNALLGVLTALVLAGCGGGGGGSAPPPPPPPAAPPPAPVDTGGVVVPVDPGGSCVAAAQQTPVVTDRVEAVARRAAITQRSSQVVAGAGEAVARQAAFPRARQIALGAVSSAKLASESAAPVSRGAPRKVGFARDLPSALASSAPLDWQTLADGRRAASLSVTSPSAAGVRLGVLVRSLPADATLRIYAQNSSTAFELPAADVLQALAGNVAAGATGNAANTYWTPMVTGAEVTLEVALPKGGDTSQVDLAVPQLSHLFAVPSFDGDTQNVAPKAIGAAGSCEVDATCSTEYTAETNAVAKMIFSDSTGSYQCTGALLNDHLNSGTPYFISANHCIPTQALASTLQTFWFYRAPSCGAGTLAPASTTLTGGATLLYASASTDTSFMRLNTKPPTGAVYAGWFVTAPAIGATVGTLHHPEGDLLKLSTGTVKSYQNCSASTTQTGELTCTGSAQAGSSGFLDALFTTGSTEEGSSGAPLFQTVGSTRYFVGQLFGGSASCSLRSGSNVYGRFDAAFNAALKQWLAAPVVPTC
jgi:lysyl endopeptidase